MVTRIAELNETSSAARVLLKIILMKGEITIMMINNQKNMINLRNLEDKHQHAEILMKTIPFFMIFHNRDHRI